MYRDTSSTLHAHGETRNSTFVTSDVENAHLVGYNRGQCVAVSQKSAGRRYARFKLESSHELLRGCATWLQGDESGSHTRIKMQIDMNRGIIGIKEKPLALVVLRRQRRGHL